MNFEKLDAYLQKLPSFGIPACELAVSKDGAIIYRNGVGYSDVAKTKPVSNRDIYWIFSTTKVITCIAAMRLVEEGRLKLDDPVSKYIPEFADITVTQEDGSVTPAKNAMTILHLFTMTGGLSYNMNTPEIREVKSPTVSTMELMRAIAKTPLLFEPGTHYKYSLCHDVLGAVIEVITGMRLSDYFDTLIFRPLGITDMGFRPNEEQKARFSAMYTHKMGTATAVERDAVNSFAFSTNFDSGGGGLFATVDEYIKIITTIACGGTTPDGYSILKPETIALMRENYLCDDALNDFVTPRHFGYGWGLCGRVHMRPELSLFKAPAGNFGWDGAAAAFAEIDPQNRVAIYLGTHMWSCNFMYNRIHPTVRNLVYEGLES